jgi:serine phosphatase RsbU (regulator of sigma subunit)
VSEVLADLRDDLTRLVVGLAAIALVVLAVVVGARYDVAIPVGFVLLPALGVALVAGPAATALVSLAAVVAVGASYIATPVGNEAARLASVIAILGLATAGSAVRRRRERSLVAHAELLAVARDHDLGAQMTQRMLERTPELSGATDIVSVARRTVSIARDVFGASACSYWQVEGDEVVLLAREPAGVWAVGDRMPRDLMAASDMVSRGTRTAWVTLDSPLSDERRDAMAHARARTGTSTPIHVDGQTVAYLTLGWDAERTAPEQSWFDLLDRFADQVALAKTVVRRRLAQDEARRLGARLQTALLPRVVTVAGGLRVRTLYRPGTRDLLLGGDFLDVAARDTEQGDVAFLIGDVSGHGPEQAAIAASLRAAWKAMARLPQLGLDDWARGLDAVLADQSAESSLFVTLLMGTANARTRRLSYVTAGHPPPLLLGPDGPRQGPLGGPPLGLVAWTTLEPRVLELDDVRGVLMVTDGIFEGHTAPDAASRVGWDDFVEIVATHDDVATTGYLDDLNAEMVRRNGDALPDDVAALLLLLPEPGAAIETDSAQSR